MRKCSVPRQLLAVVMGGVLVFCRRIRTLRFSCSVFLVAALTPGLTGCVGFLDAELNNRGGFVDAKLDDYWMVADTKQMRMLRAYVLIGSITRLAETQYASEKEAIAKQVNTAVYVASDAYYCAYSAPGNCVYFDERLAELEVHVLRLLVAVLSKKENEDVFDALTKQVGESAPLLKGLTSLTSLVEAVTSTGEIAVSAGKLLTSVLKIGQAGYKYGRRIGALYRDSIELEMITVLSSLDAQCSRSKGVYTEFDTTTLEYKVHRLSKEEEWASRQFYGDVDGSLDACRALATGYPIWNKGSGDLSLWVDYLKTTALPFRETIVPNQNAFIQASDLVWRSCEQLTGADKDLLSECLGRRTKSGEKVIDCAAVDGQIEKVVWDDRCRLILYALTAYSRADRRGRADARISWLSKLSPSIGHPLSTRMESTSNPGY
jgi:hypothetical protein